MQVIGFDPALANIGWAVIEDRKFMEGGVITTPSKQPLGKRLKHVASEVRAVMKRFPEADVHIEHPGYGKMYGTHYVWMGIAAIALAITPREAVFITAPQARKDLVGRGDADKTDVREKLRKRFGAQVDDLSDDTTDALCIALCKKPVAVELNYRKK